MRVLINEGDFTNPPDNYLCCKELKQQFSGCSSGQHTNCPDWCIRFVDFSQPFREKFEVKEFILQAENATYAIKYCPFCGKKFPDSKRPTD